MPVILTIAALFWQWESILIITCFNLSYFAPAAYNWAYCTVESFGANNFAAENWMAYTDTVWLLVCVDTFVPYYYYVKNAPDPRAR